MTRRKLNNPTKLSTGVSHFECPDSPPANNEVLDLVIRPEANAPEQEQAMDFSWKRPRLDEGSISGLNSEPISNGLVSGVAVKKEPKLTSTPQHQKNSASGASKNSSPSANFMAATWLQSLMNQQPVRLPNALPPNLDLSQPEANLSLLLQAVTYSDNKYIRLLPKLPSDEMVKTEPLLVQTYQALVVKACELTQLMQTYEELVRNVHRSAVVVSSASAGPGSQGPRHPALNGASVLAGLPLQQTSPSAGSLSPLNSPHFPVGGSGSSAPNGAQPRPLAPGPRRLSGPGSESGVSLLSGHGGGFGDGLDGDVKMCVKKSPAATGRKRNDRRADSEMNEPNLDFIPHCVVDSDSVEQVQLSSKYPAVTICREKYNEIIRKGESSATRVIRMIMKHFFEPEVLAVSSLSGTGQYKEVLNPHIVNAIKDFISNRYPKLRSSRLNLCMTDVCVQARRVKTNQSRRGGSHVLPEPEDEANSISQVMGDAGSNGDSNSSHDVHPHEQDDLDLNVTAPSLPAALGNRPLSPPSEGEGRLVIEERAGPFLTLSPATRPAK